MKRITLYLYAQSLMKKGLCAFLVVSLSLACLPTASAAPSTAEQIADLQTQATSVRTTLDNLATELEMAGEELAQIQEDQASLETSIAATQEQITEAQENLEQKKAALVQRVVQTYRGDPVTYINVLLDSSSFSDFISSVFYVQKMNQADSAAIEEISELKTSLEQSEASLQTQLDEQNRLVEEAAAKQADIENSIAAQQTILDSLDDDVSELVEQQRAEEEAAAMAKAAAAAAAKTSNSSNSSSSDNSSSGSSSGSSSSPASGSSSNSGIYRTFSGNLGSSHPEIVGIALQYLGCPYVWGATGYYSSAFGSQVFDCSGLTQYCYKQIGITIPRVSVNQFWNQSGYIPPDRTDLLQPGDLVFFGYSANQGSIHHVGIYIGNNQFIHAPQTGDVVKISYLSGRSDYVGAIRV